MVNRHEEEEEEVEDNQINFAIYQVLMVDTFEDEIVKDPKVEHPLMYQSIPIDYVHQMFQMVDKDLLDNMNINHLDFALETYSLNQNDLDDIH